MCLSHWDNTAFNTQFGTNCPGLLIPSTLFPHCLFMPTHLHLVIAILAPTAKKDPIVCHVHSFESLKWKGQPCATAAKTKLGRGQQAGTSSWSHLTSVHMGEQENVHFLGQRWIFLDIPPPTALQIVQKWCFGPDFKKNTQTKTFSLFLFFCLFFRP